MKQPQLTPYEVYRAAITNDIPKIMRQAKRERLLKRVLAITAACAVIAVAMSSCTGKDKHCSQCTTTETTSHGTQWQNQSTLEVCGQQTIQDYINQNTGYTRYTQWVGPGITDSLTVEIYKHTECSGVIYSN